MSAWQLVTASAEKGQIEHGWRQSPTPPATTTWFERDGHNLELTIDFTDGVKVTNITLEETGDRSISHRTLMGIPVSELAAQAIEWMGEWWKPKPPPALPESFVEPAPKRTGGQVVTFGDDMKVTLTDDDGQATHPLAVDCPPTNEPQFCELPDSAIAKYEITPLLTIKQVAKALGLTTSALDGMRARGIAPPAIKMGRLVRFRADDLEAWIAERAETP